MDCEDFFAQVCEERYISNLLRKNLIRYLRIIFTLSNCFIRDFSRYFAITPPVRSKLSFQKAKGKESGEVCGGGDCKPPSRSSAESWLGDQRGEAPCS